MFFHPTTWTLSATATPGAVRIPTFLALLCAPLMGAVFAIFLPAIGLYLVVEWAAGRVMAEIRHHFMGRMS